MNPAPQVTNCAKKISSDKFLSLLKSTQNLSDSSALKRLENAGIVSPLIFLGGEDLRIKRLTDWICTKLFGNDSQVQRISAEQITSNKNVEPLIESLRSPSLFCDEDIIVISNAEQIKANIAKPLAEAILKRLTSTFVVVVTASLNQKTPLPYYLSKASGTLVEFSELKGQRLIDWITKEALRHNETFGIAPDAALLISQCYGNDLWIISHELEKLSLSLDKKETISLAMVEESLLQGPERTSFELITQIAKKHLTASIDLTHALMNQGLHPLQISAFLSRAFRTLIAIKENETKHLSICQTLSNPWFMRNIQANLSAFSFAELVNSLKIISDLDFRLKSTGLPDELLTSLAIKRLTLRETQL
ncbi:MAG: DNA polymerase III subunit delta [Deltaproteobacteria bacterium]|nr:DNA polymerase III subunit delta [Deltaproteobacteria bacterium]